MFWLYEYGLGGEWNSSGAASTAGSNIDELPDSFSFESDLLVEDEAAGGSDALGSDEDLMTIPITSLKHFTGKIIDLEDPTIELPFSIQTELGVRFIREHFWLLQDYVELLEFGFISAQTFQNLGIDGQRLVLRRHRLQVRMMVMLKDIWLGFEKHKACAKEISAVNSAFTLTLCKHFPIDIIQNISTYLRVDWALFYAMLPSDMERFCGLPFDPIFDYPGTATELANQLGGNLEEHRKLLYLCRIVHERSWASRMQSDLLWSRSLARIDLDTRVQSELFGPGL